MDLLIKGKTALVTGGSSGIGRGIASALAEEGCNVIITARDEERIKEAVDAISKNNVSVSGYRCDVFNDDEIKSVLDKIVFYLVVKLGVGPEARHVVDLKHPWLQFVVEHHIETKEITT